MMHADWRLRPAEESDEAFLRQLYGEVRAAEIALFGWDEVAATAFLRIQFDAQQRHYAAAYPGARFDIVEQGGSPVGRLTVHRTADEIRLVDIALLASQRNRGLGSALLQSLLDEAQAAGKRVTLQVEQHNRARALYRRLGFFETGPESVYLPMAWQPLGSTIRLQEK